MKQGMMESEDRMDEVNNVEEEDWSLEMKNAVESGNYVSYSHIEHIPLHYCSPSFPCSYCTHQDFTLTQKNKKISNSSSLSSNNKGYCPYQMRLYSIECLSPLDMMALCNGVYDATGNRVWMGAYFFVKVFVHNYYNCYRRKNSSQHNENQSFFRDKKRKIMSLYKLRKAIFHNKNILELGCGTGCSGISLLLNFNHDHCLNENYDKNSIHNSYNAIDNFIRTDENDLESKLTDSSSLTFESPQPSSVTFTDSDLGCLELCRRNCNLNLKHVSNDMTLPFETSSELSICPEILQTMTQFQILNNKIKHRSKYAICPLTWTKNKFDDQNGNPTDSLLKQPPSSCHYDTTIATDVIYDVSSIVPLMCTAFRYTKTNGYFILSHVPRAYYEIDLNVPNTRKNTQVEKLDNDLAQHLSPLELFILEKAQKYGFELDELNEHCNDNDPAHTYLKHFYTRVSISKVKTKFQSNHRDFIHVGVIRPNSFQQIQKKKLEQQSIDDNNSLQSMQDSGCAIFVFRKKNPLCRYI